MKFHKGNDKCATACIAYFTATFSTWKTQWAAVMYTFLHSLFMLAWLSSSGCSLLLQLWIFTEGLTSWDMFSNTRQKRKPMMMGYHQVRRLTKTWSDNWETISWSNVPKAAHEPPTDFSDQLMQWWPALINTITSTTSLFIDFINYSVYCYAYFVTWCNCSIVCPKKPSCADSPYFASHTKYTSRLFSVHTFIYYITTLYVGATNKCAYERKLGTERVHMLGTFCIIRVLFPKVVSAIFTSMSSVILRSHLLNLVIFLIIFALLVPSLFFNIVWLSHAIFTHLDLLLLSTFSIGNYLFFITFKVLTALFILLYHLNIRVNGENKQINAALKLPRQVINGN